MPSSSNAGLRAAIARVTATALVTLLAACGGDSSGPSGPVTLTVSGASAALSFVGATVQLTARDANGPVASARWSTSDGSVASVEATSGLVSAVGPGTATISAQAGNAVGSTTVNVDLVPATLVSQAGNAQSGTVASALPTPVAVVVLDQGGAPIPGEAVAFQASNSGSVSPATATTDGQGRAQATWTLGTLAGAQTLTATSGGKSVQWTATATPGAAAALVAQVGNGQVSPAGELVATPVGALVSDAYGNGIAGVVVSFAVTPGNGILSSGTALTNAQGIASVQWTLDRYAGVKTITATAAGLTAVSFTATATPNGTVSGVAAPVNAWTSPLPAAYGASLGSPKAPTPFSDFAQVVGPTTPPGLPVRELIVTFRKPTGAAFFQSATNTVIADAQALALKTLSADLPRAESFRAVGASPVLFSVRVEVADGVDPATLARDLQADPRIERVELNRLQSVHGRALPMPRSLPSTRRPLLPTPPPPASDEALYPWQAWHYESIGLQDAWRFTKGAPNVVVAVVDDGIRFDHPDVAATLLPDGFDFVSGGDLPLCAGGQVDNGGDGDGPDPDPTIPTLYKFNQAKTCIQTVGGTGGHGLHVAGTIAAQDHNGGGVGIAPGVRILPVRVMGPHGLGFEYDIAQGILYAAGLPADGGTYGTVQAPYGAHVINLSLGGGSPSTTQHAAVQAATAAGSLVIASAGNEGTTVPNYPASFPEAMSVSAVGPNWSKPSYSSYGSAVEIAAPGGARGDAGRDDFGVLSTNWDFDTNSPTWASWDGTSMATPHVVGVAALLFSQDPSRSAATVRSLLTTYARDLGAPGRDDTYGMGLLDALASLSQGAGVPGQTWVQLHDATTGAPVRTTLASANGAFSLGGLPDGNYHLYAGLDTFGDGVFGVPGRPWSAYPAYQTPTLITVDGAGNQVRSFSFGYAFETEPNQNRGTANLLMVGGYVEGLLTGGADVDFYRFAIGTAGTYVFETYGVFGACGFAIVPDTVLDLLDASGIPIANGDDIDLASGLRCSRIFADLQPGTYYLRVGSFGSAGNGGLYGLTSGAVN